LRHAFRTSDVAQRLGNESRISAGFFDVRFKVCSHFFRGAQMLCDVVTGCSCFSHFSVKMSWYNKTEKVADLRHVLTHPGAQVCKSTGRHT
jgi:hypothetical protein